MSLTSSGFYSDFWIKVLCLGIEILFLKVIDIGVIQNTILIENLIKLSLTWVFKINQTNVMLDELIGQSLLNNRLQHNYTDIELPGKYR
jgi:hypothetical protein